MAINEAALQAARDRRGVQDKKNPYLIHRDTGRLLPNVEHLRKHPKMLVYKGSPTASHDERMRYVRTGSFRQGVDTTAPEAELDLPPFDLGTATKEQMIAFAKEEFNLDLNPNAPPHIMRAQIKRAADDSNQLG